MPDSREAQTGELSSRLLREASRARPSAEKLRAYVEVDLGCAVILGAYSYITDALHILGASTLFDDIRSEWLKPDPARVSLPSG